MSDDGRKLVERARDGDTSALRILFFRSHDRLLSLVSAGFPSDLRSACDPEDVLQVTYSDASEAIRNFVPTRQNNFFAWMATIARRNLTDLIRFHRAAKRGGGMKRQGSDGSPDNGTQDWYDFFLQESLTPSRAVAKEEALAALRLALGELRPDYRQVIELRYLLQLSEDETAKRMGRAVSTIHGLCFRATRKLRERMGRYSRFFSAG